MERRDFLSPENWIPLGDALLGDALRTSPRGGSPAEAEAEPGLLLRFMRRAMATQFEVVLPLGTPGAAACAAACLDVIDHWESRLTVYREESDVSQINARAFRETIAVEPQLFDLLWRSRHWFQHTQGAFDVALGALIDAWGFRQGPPRMPSPEERREAQQRSGMAHVDLDPERRSIRFRRDGAALNLGSIGKGFALDRAAERLRETPGCRAALLQAGGSSVLAIGGIDERRGWTIRLRHPYDSERCLGAIHLRDLAMGTSSARYQHLPGVHERLGHVLDPRTGWPAQGTLQACAFAPLAADADALASAFFVGGAKVAEAVCAAHPEAGAILLTEPAERLDVFGIAHRLFIPGGEP